MVSNSRMVRTYIIIMLSMWHASFSTYSLNKVNFLLQY